MFVKFGITALLATLMPPPHCCAPPAQAHLLIPIIRRRILYFEYQPQKTPRARSRMRSLIPAPAAARSSVISDTEKLPAPSSSIRPQTSLYLVLGTRPVLFATASASAVKAFTWSGVKHVARKAEWPDWYPPAEMISFTVICRA